MYMYVYIHIYIYIYHIYNDVTQRGLRAETSWGESAHAWLLVPADRASLNAQASRLGRLGRSPGPPGPLAQAAWDAEVDRKDRPIGSEAPFSTILGGSAGRFSSFSEVTSRERVDS